jgi:toxin HigB-1
MINSFSNKSTEDLFNRKPARHLPSAVQKVAYRKLLLIDAAEKLADLRVPPGNRLERLSGDLAGKYSIRINDQWRIIFSWKANNAYEVKITDYHKE